jgi:hypothetical protein
VSRFLVLGVFAALAGCASGDGIVAGRRFAMNAGQQVALPDASTLRYAGTANDSRCPPGVQCIRAGDADVLFDHAVHGSIARITLNTERTRSAVVGTWRLGLVELAPGEAPRVTLVIEANTGAIPP